MTAKDLCLEKTFDQCKSGEPKITAIFIHGIASDSSSFNKALEFLVEKESLCDVRLVAFDLLGAGKSYNGDDLEYTYDEQLSALRRAIGKLDTHTPIILVGHSMGTFIATRYASVYNDSANKLILVSPPIYTTQDLEDPMFEKAVDVFRDAVSIKNHDILTQKSFVKSMQNIVFARDNYDALVRINIPTVLIYGDADKFIASFNIPEVLKSNSNITAIKTIGNHGVTHDKYTKIAEILEEELNNEAV